MCSIGFGQSLNFYLFMDILNSYFYFKAYIWRHGQSIEHTKGSGWPFYDTYNVTLEKYIITFV